MQNKTFQSFISEWKGRIQSAFAASQPRQIYTGRKAYCLDCQAETETNNSRCSICLSEAILSCHCHN